MSAQLPRREFYDCKDIMSILGVSKSKVYEFLDELEAQNKIVHIGRRKLVRVVVFYQHLADQDGYMPHEYRAADYEDKKSGFKVMSGGKKR